MKRLSGQLLSHSSRLKSGNLLVYVFGFGIIGYIILNLTFAAPVPQATSNTSTDQVAQLIADTDQLKSSVIVLKEADNKHDTTRLEKFKPAVAALTKKRKAELKSVIKSNPRAARKALLSSDNADTINENSLGQDLEQSQTLTGSYGMVQQEGGGSDEIYSTIQTSDKKIYRLNTDERLPQIGLGSTITVSGKVVDDQILLNASSNDYGASGYGSQLASFSSGSVAPVAINNQVNGWVTTTGTIKIAVIMMNVIDYPSTDSPTTVDPSMVRSVYTDSPKADLADWIAENSYGKANLSVDFFGPYNVSQSFCNENAIETAAYADASSSTTYSQYSRLSVVDNCGGNSRATSGSCISTPQGCIHTAGTYISSVDAHVVFHETAHTMDAVNNNFLNHGGYLDCAPNVFTPPVNSAFDNHDCVIAEYQDPYDPLGKLTGHLSLSHKIDAGWIGPDQAPSVTSPGTTEYVIQPLENGSGLLGLKIPRGNTGTFFTVENRQPIGFDSIIATDTGACRHCNANSGALIRFGGLILCNPSACGGGVDSAIIDTTPNSNQTGDYWPSDDGNDGTLLPGQIFTDPEYGIKIKTISDDAGGLKVDITIPATNTCTVAAPSITLASNSSQTIDPGNSATYSYVVTNNDSAGCQTDTFKIAPNASNYQVVDENTISVNISNDVIKLAPGESKTISAVVSAGPKTPKNSYYLNGAVQVYSKPYSIPVVSAPTAILNVTGPSDSQKPSAPGNVTATILGSSIVKIAWSPSTDNNGVCEYSVGGYLVGGSDTSYILSVAPGLAQSVSVYAQDCSNNFSDTSTVSFTTPAMPGQPAGPSSVTGLNAIVGEHSVKLTWQSPGPNSNTAKYQIVDTSTWLTYFVPADQNSFTFNSLISGSYYNFEVAAVSGDNVSSGYTFLTTQTANAGDVIGPSQPQHLYSTVSNNGGITLSWQPSTGPRPIVGYNILRGCCKASYVTTNTYTDTTFSGTTFRVQAVDSNGNLSPMSDQFPAPSAGPSYSNEKPSASITSINNGDTKSGTITLQSTANATSGVQGLTYYLDGHLLNINLISGSPYSLALDTTHFSNGHHWLVAEAFSSNNAKGSSGGVDFIINNSDTGSVSPAVYMTYPSSSQSLSGTVALLAYATDNIGVSKVDFYSDGTFIGSGTVNGNTYSFNWNTTTAPSGNHNITAKATNTSGNITTSTPLTVSLSGSGTGGTKLGDCDGNGTVDLLDLSSILGNWGTNFPLCDFDKSGTIDLLDLSTLLGNWTG